MNTAYKIYASILNDMLVKKFEGKLAEEQLEFRKEKGTIDEIYILNHIVNGELTIRRRKVFVFFADIKRTFDRLDGTELHRMLKMKEINAHMRERIIEIYKETKNVVSSAEKETGTFWTEKAVRQECPLSPTLFNLYISDLNKEISKVKEGGILNRWIQDMDPDIRRGCDIGSIGTERVRSNDKQICQIHKEEDAGIKPR